MKAKHQEMTADAPYCGFRGVLFPEAQLLINKKAQLESAGRKRCGRLREMMHMGNGYCEA